MFAMATGRPPYQGASALHILQRVTDQRTPLTREINERMPAWLDRLIALCHTKSVHDRIASAEVLTELIRQCLAHVQKPNVFALPKEVSQQRASRPMLVGAGLIAGTLLGLWGGWYMGPMMSSFQGPRQENSAPDKRQTQVTNEHRDAQIEVVLPSTGGALSAPMPTIQRDAQVIQKIDSQERRFDDESARLRSRVLELQLQIERDWK